MNQVSLVSLYGRKSALFEGMIKKCWEFIEGSSLRKVFTPYRIEQVHGTISGMERLAGYVENYNANIWQDCGVKEVMQFDGLVDVLKKHLPMKVQVGGFKPDYREFTSLGMPAYERSFQVQWKTNKVTLIGWPHVEGDFVTRRCLWNLRNELKEACGIRPKYVNDNDLFFVIGELSGVNLLPNEDVNELKTAALWLERVVRDYLSGNWLAFEISLEEIWLAQYEQETLSMETTRVYCMADEGIDSRFIKALYN